MTMNSQKIMIDNYYISTDKHLIDIHDLWLLLKDCFWTKNIPIEYVERFTKHSLCFGIYSKNKNILIGFGRVISDYTTFAYICDVVIEKKYRNMGLGFHLIQSILSHEDLRGLKTWSLKTTDDAKNLYKKFGFKTPDLIDVQLEIDNLEIYSDSDFVNLHQ